MKLTTPYIIITDPVPEETTIYYSRQNALYRLIPSVVVLGFGIPVLVSNSLNNDRLGFIVVAIFCVTFFLLAIRNLRMFFNDEPQFVIGYEGIKTACFPFFNWADITKAEVTSKIERGTVFYFKYESLGGKQKIRVKDLNIQPTELIYLLGKYKNG